MRRQWTVRVVTGFAVVAVGLGGCSEKHEASDTLPDPTTATTTTASGLPPLGPADFPVPAEARTQDAAGAEAALRYYLALVDRVNGITGEPLRELSSDCATCTFLATRNDQDSAAGIHSTGGRTTVVSMSPPALHETAAEFSFSITQQPIAVQDSAGKLVPDRQSPGVALLVGAAAMQWDEQSQAWLMTQIFFTPPS